MPPCTPTNPTALQILNNCEAAFPANRTDCNHFVKAAMKNVLPNNYFDGLNADGIVAKLNDPAEGWTKTTSITQAITDAKNGCVVIAGMTSNELNQAHGHLAIAVGCNGGPSGPTGTIVPHAYAGSIGSEIARIAGKTLSWTFAAEAVRNEEINYYIKTVM